ncbi:MAG: TniB family NTP-binding protein [Pseudomonadales bacterium]
MTPHSTGEINYRQIARKISDAFGKFPQVTSLLNNMEDRFQAALSPGEPEHLLVTGEPGTGKSTILRHFATSYPSVVHEEWTEVPVIYAEIPARTTIKALAGILLQAMGSPFWDKGDETQRTRQLRTLLAGCKTRMIILDEINHLVDRGGVRTHYHVGDWIKQLSGPGGPVLVLAGTPRAELLLATNAQLRSRFGQQVIVHALSANDQHIKLFSKVLKSFEGRLPPLPCIDLGDPAVTRQFAFATDGRLRAICHLLRRAVAVASRASAPRIDGETLAQAFVEAIYASATPERNPVHPKFNGIPLARAGEPFAPEAARG